MMKLFQLHTGDEFTVKGEDQIFKLKPSDDQVFLDTGELRVENTLTGDVSLLKADTLVVLKNVA